MVRWLTLPPRFGIKPEIDIPDCDTPNSETPLSVTANCATPTVNYTIDWGDGNVTTLSGGVSVSTSHRFLSTGTRTVKVFVEDSRGRRAVVSKKILINTMPEVTVDETIDFESQSDLDYWNDVVSPPPPVSNSTVYLTGTDYMRDFSYGGRYYLDLAVMSKFVVMMYIDVKAVPPYEPSCGTSCDRLIPVEPGSLYVSGKPINYPNKIAGVEILPVYGDPNSVVLIDVASRENFDSCMSDCGGFYCDCLRSCCNLLNFRIVDNASKRWLIIYVDYESLKSYVMDRCGRIIADMPLSTIDANLVATYTPDVYARADSNDIVIDLKIDRVGLGYKLAPYIKDVDVGVNIDNLDVTLTLHVANTKYGGVPPYQATIDWGDGYQDTIWSNTRYITASHSYDVSNTYTITITDLFDNEGRGILQSITKEVSVEAPPSGGGGGGVSGIWPMFHYDVRHTGRTDSVASVIYVGSDDNYLYAINPDGTLKWTYQTGDYITSSPAIGSDGTIYVGSRDNYLYAINPDGTLKWRYQTGGAIDYSSPAIGSDGTIYVGSLDNYLYAINPDGTLKWRYQTGDGIASSPAIGSDGTIYVGSDDTYLYAINPDGTLKWKYQTGDAVVSSPAIGSDGTIYVGSNDYYLYAINPDGTLKWRYQTGYSVISSPAIGSDGTIYVGGGNYYLYAINPDGTLKWEYQVGDAVISSPAIGSDGTIYVGSDDNYLYAINSDGTLKWRYQTGNYIESSPAIDGDGIIYVGSHDYYLYAINPDGTLKWRYQTGNAVESAPAIG